LVKNPDAIKATPFYFEGTNPKARFTQEYQHSKKFTQHGKNREKLYERV